MWLLVVVSYLWAVIQRSTAETGHSTVPLKTHFACHSILKQPQPGVFLRPQNLTGNFCFQFVPRPSLLWLWQAREETHKLTSQALTNEFLPPLFVEILSHLGDGSGFFWKVTSSVSRKPFRFTTLCARCLGNFPPAAVDKPKQIWADKSHPEWSNLVWSYNSVQYGPFRDRMRH